MLQKKKISESQGIDQPVRKPIKKPDVRGLMDQRIPSPLKKSVREGLSDDNSIRKSSPSPIRKPLSNRVNFRQNSITEDYSEINHTMPSDYVDYDDTEDDFETTIPDDDYNTYPDEYYLGSSDFDIEDEQDYQSLDVESVDDQDEFSFDDVLTMALALQHAGLPILPVCPGSHVGMTKAHKESCLSPGKAPLIQGWNEISEVTENDIAKWVYHNDIFNIGLVLGDKSGIVAIDVDGKEGSRMLKQYLPELLDIDTVEFLTPGDGHRYLFSLPDHVSIPNFSIKGEQQHSELAILSNGRYTVMPPSLHANGGIYRFVEGKSIFDIPIATVPECVKKLANSKKLNDLQPDFGGEKPREGQIILNNLAQNCKHFGAYLVDSRKNGSDAGRFIYLWLRLLINENQIEAARALAAMFSYKSIMLNRKIDEFVQAQTGENFGNIRCEKLVCPDNFRDQCVEKYKNMTSPGFFISKNMLALNKAKQQPLRQIPNRPTKIR